MCGLRSVIQRVKTFVNKIMENSNNRNMSQKYTFNRISSCIDRILIIMLMCVVLGFAKCSINDNAENRSLIYEETESPVFYMGCPPDYFCKLSVCCNSAKHPITKKIYVFPLLKIAFFVALAAMEIVLLVMFVKSDSFLKFAKLDELNEVKQKLLEGKFNDSYNKMTEFYDVKETKTATKENGSSPKKTLLTETSNQADLLKHYMTCVTEI